MELECCRNTSAIALVEAPEERREEIAHFLVFCHLSKDLLELRPRFGGESVGFDDDDSRADDVDQVCGIDEVRLACAEEEDHRLADEPDLLLIPLHRTEGEEEVEGGDKRADVDLVRECFDECEEGNCKLEVVKLLARDQWDRLEDRSDRHIEVLLREVHCAEEAGDRLDRFDGH